MMLLSVCLVCSLSVVVSGTLDDGPPVECYHGLEKETGKPILFNPNISTCSPRGLQYCYRFTYADSRRRTAHQFGCVSTSDHPCTVLDFSVADCRDEIKLGEESGLMCCSKQTKKYIPRTFSPVAKCYTGTTNSSGDFIEGSGEPEKCDETKSLYCVTKMKVLPDNTIAEARFFCDLTTVGSACSDDTLSSCSELTNVSATEPRDRVCCCGTSECNLPEYMLRRPDAITNNPFPGSPMLLYILLIVFGCIVLLGLIMMAGKQCGASSNDSVDFDDKASFDRLDFDETENDEPTPSDRPMTKVIGKDKFEQVDVTEPDESNDEPSPSDEPITATASV